MTNIYRTRRLSALWHGASAGILKTMPKCVSAVVVKDYLEDTLPAVDRGKKSAVLLRSAFWRERCRSDLSTGSVAK